MAPSCRVLPLLLVCVLPGPAPGRSEPPPKPKGEETQRNSVGMILRLIPAGGCERGARDNDTDAFDDEKPRRAITISRPFRLSVHEVTQGQFRAVMGKNESQFQGDDLPVENVSWWDAVEFCNRLGQREGKRPRYKIEGKTATILKDGNGYRLPTEAEWEYAARAGSTAKWSFGDDPEKLGEHAWFLANSDSRTRPVGGKMPNGFGLHDMAGNVWEWCEDGYGATYYKESPVTDPPGPAEFTNRVVRGGGWDGRPWDCRPSYRGRSAPEYRDFLLGFRVVKVEEP